MRSPLLCCIVLVGCGLETYAPPDGGLANASDSGHSESTLFGDAQISPGSLNFGQVEVDGEATRDLVVSNVGSGTVDVTSVSVQGDAFGFDITTGLPWSLGGNDTAVVSVSFSPYEVNDFDGTVLFEISGLDEPAEISLAGKGILGGSGDTGSGDGGADTGSTGTSGSLEVSSTSVSFGTSDLYDTVTEDITITNVAGTDVLISDITTPSSDLTIEGEVTPPAVISDGNSKTVTLVWTPTSEGTLSDSSSSRPTRQTHPAPRCRSAALPSTSATSARPVISVDTGGDSAYAIDDFVSLLGSTDTRTITDPERRRPGPRPSPAWT